MIFGGKVQYHCPAWVAKQIGLPQLDLLAPTARSVIFKHRWVTLFELKRNALAHHSDAIDGVDQSLRPAFKKISASCR